MGRVKPRMKPVMAWMIVGNMTGNTVYEPYRLRSSARTHRRGMTFPAHYRIARVQITEVRATHGRVKG